MKRMRKGCRRAPETDRRSSGETKTSCLVEFSTSAHIGLVERGSQRTETKAIISVGGLEYSNSGLFKVRDPRSSVSQCLILNSSQGRMPISCL